MKSLVVPGLLTLGLILGACGEGEETSDGEALALVDEVVVTTPFLAWAAKRLVGDAVPVVYLVPEGDDPATWRPTRDDLLRMRRARLVVANGATFEKWLPTASLPRSRLVETADAARDRWIQLETTTHRHGAGGEHTHGGTDGHTWRDPELASEQVKHLGAVLGTRFPAQAAAVNHALPDLMAGIGRVREAWSGFHFGGGSSDGAEKTGGKTPGRFLASHPGYDYLARRLGVSLTSFGFDPAVALGDAELGEIRRRVPVARLRIMIWEREPVAASVAALEALGIRSLVLAPLDVGEDWVEKSVRDAEALARLAPKLKRGADSPRPRNGR